MTLNCPVGLPSIATMSDPAISPDASSVKSSLHNPPSASSNNNRKWRRWNPPVTDVTALKKPAAVRIPAMDMEGTQGAPESTSWTTRAACPATVRAASCGAGVERRLVRMTTSRPRLLRPVESTRRFQWPAWLRLPPPWRSTLSTVCGTLCGPRPEPALPLRRLKWRCHGRPGKLP